MAFQRQRLVAVLDGGLPVRQRTVLAASAADGETVIEHFDAEFAPCDCVTHRIQGVDCVIVARGPHTGRRLNHRICGERHYRCLLCNAAWVAWYSPGGGVRDDGDA